jgi:DNA-3-methyladenine glycosylase II
LKGIGLWTAQMFLIFSLGRQNVLPSTDLGFIKALQKNYGLKEKPDKEQINEIAKNWEPYKTIASLYIWATTDNGTEY